MPDGDGLALFDCLRALPDGDAVPFDVVSGSSERVDRYRALKAGAWDYLVKPVDGVELVLRDPSSHWAGEYWRKGFFFCL